jgi:murein DD-endopeptidase MepM/ murein hydrolase activator NlpD
MTIQQVSIVGLFVIAAAVNTYSFPTRGPKNTSRPDISLKNEFSENEKRVIKIATPGLFEENDRVTINLSELSRNEWCYPLRNGRVISPYGGRRRHSGMDIKTHPNDTVYAAFSGRVRFSKPYSGYGNVIVLRHATGMETLYSHNKRNLVRIGDYVKAGEPIAIVGRTGRATTEHVHFEVRINGHAYNPARFFDPITRTLRSLKVVAYKSGRIETINVVPGNNIARESSEKSQVKSPAEG